MWQIIVFIIVIAIFVGLIIYNSRKRKAEKRAENEKLRKGVLEDVKRHIIRINGEQAYQDNLSIPYYQFDHPPDEFYNIFQQNNLHHCNISTILSFLHVS